MMADRAIHFGVGITLGLLIALPRLYRDLKSGNMLAPAFARLLAISCGVGLLAVVPNVLHRMGCSSAFCSGWWMNIFVAHHLIGQLRPGGGALIGQVLIVLCFSSQYALMFAALLRQHYRNLGRPIGS